MLVSFCTVSNATLESNTMYKVVAAAHRVDYWLCENRKGELVWQRGSSGKNNAKLFSSHAEAQAAITTTIARGAEGARARIVPA